MIIYKTTNLINGKVYVGKARGIRVSNNYLGSGVLLQKAIDKYGKDNFKRTTIDICESRVDQNRKEIFWIAFYREKLGKDAVYNVSDGGDGQSFGFMHSEKTRQKISALLNGEKHPMYGKHHSEETKRKMSEKHIGILFSEETRHKMSIAHKGMLFSEEHKNKLRKPKSEETKRRMSIANKGQIPWNKKKENSNEI